MDDPVSEDRCTGCGLKIEGGDEACNTRFQALTARNFTDARFGRLHGLVVDTYCLQHPDRYCISAKSLAAHLCGLCGALERGASSASPNMVLQSWLDGTVDLTKPKLPARRGAVTIADVDGTDDPQAYDEAVHAWAASVWAAYTPLHDVARQWLDQATESGLPKRRQGKQ